MLNEHYMRLGFYRSTTTMGLPNFFGNLCLLILPVALYYYHHSRSVHCLFVISLDYYAMIHSGCRSSMLFSVPVLALYFLLILSTKEDRCRFMKNLFGIFLSISAVIILLSIINPEYRYFYTGTIKSLLNEIGFNFDLNEGAPTGIYGFGINGENGTLSRLSQLSGIYYTLTQNPIFGLGSGALNRKEMRYFAYNKWQFINTYDLGLVEIISEEGILGLLGFLSLFISIFVTIRRESPSKAYSRIVFIEAVAYLLCTLSTANMTSFLFMIVIAAFYPSFSSSNYELEVNS